MVRISLRYKVALELYASLSLLAAIIVIIYFSIFGMIVDNFYVPAGIVILFSIAFVLALRTLIFDVNSVTFENNEVKDDVFIVEIKRINKISMEIVAGISNIILFSIIYMYSISKSSGANEFLSLVFVIILCVPILIVLKTLIFEFGTIFLSKKNRENFVTDIINRKSIFFIFVCIIILLSIASSNVLITAVGKIYMKSMLPGEIAIRDISSNLQILSITGIRENISGAPITELNIFIKSEKFNVNVSTIIVRYMDDAGTSYLRYGTISDESHFSYEIKGTENTAKENRTGLRPGETGIIKINLSSNEQELYSYKKSSIKLTSGRDSVLKDIRAPELKEGIMITLFRS